MTSTTALREAARWPWLQPIAGHLLLLAIAACSYTSSAMIIDPAAGGVAFLAEPPATFLVSSPAATSVNCSLLVQEHGLRLRWRYEEIDRSGGVGTSASIAASNYVGTDASAASSAVGPPFYDAGNGQLVFLAGSNDADFVANGLPKYKLYCEARTSGGVVRSRMLQPKKVSTLRTCKPVLNCFSGHLNGSAVCQLQTDPNLQRLSDNFKIDYFREPLAADDRCSNSNQELLVYNPARPKYATFNAERGQLHVMSLNQSDTRYCYRARISLLDSANREVYWNMSEPRPVRIIESVVSRIEVSRTEVSYNYRDGLSVLLPCYAGGTSRGGAGYSWRKDGVPLPVGAPGTKQKYNYLDANSGNLRLRIDGRNDSGSYECQHNDHTVQYATLHLYKPLEAHLPVPQVSVDHNASLLLNCTVRGWPLSRIFWLRNGVRLPAGDSRCRMETIIDAQGDGESAGRLTIAGIGLADRGAYQCVAERDLAVSSLVPYDSAQDTLMLTVNKAPPQLIEQSPELPFAPAFLNGSDSGQFSCLFRAFVQPVIRVTLDGSAALFDDLQSRSVFHFQKDDRGLGDVFAVLKYYPSSLEHTGRIAIEARNAYGVANCRMTLFAAVQPPVLLVRDFERQQLAVVYKPFNLDCNVLGGLNAMASSALERVRLAYPGLRVPTYSLEWQMQPGSGQLLVLPKDHRMLVNDPALPDRLHVTSVEFADAGIYTCKAKQGDSRTAYTVTTPAPQASTTVSVVHGISVSKLQDQLNLESGLAIADTCKPINSPTGWWLAWWTYRRDGEAHDMPLPDGAVGHAGPSHAASEYSYDSYNTVDLTDRCRKLQVDLLREAGLSHGYSFWNRSAILQLRPTILSADEPHRYQGLFTCHIASCFDRKSAVKRVTLKGEYHFQANMPPNSQEVVLDSQLNVHCAVVNPGNPPPQIRWYEGNRPLDSFKVEMYRPDASPPQRIAQFANATLRIAKVLKTDQNFLCAVDGSRSATLNLNIRLPATVHPFEPARIEVPVGSSRKVQCKVEGDWPNTVHWFGKFQASGNVRCNLSSEFQYELLPACSKSLAALDGGPAAQIRVTGDTLQFVSVSQGLRGEYSCRATNRFSRKASEQSFEVLVVEPPSIVRSLQLTDRGHESLTLQWEAPASSGHKSILHYTIQFQSADGSRRSLNVSELDRKYTVTGLQPGFSYDFAVSAVNSVGAGPAEHCSGTTRERPPSGPARSLRVRAVGSAGLELVWDEPDVMLRNGFITNYSVHFRDVSAGALTDCPDDASVASGGFQMALRCPSLRAVIGVGDSVAQCRNASVALRAFTDYQIRVTPANAVGNGPPACAVARTLEATPRLPPRQVRCTPKNRSQILVTWIEPDFGSVNGDVEKYHVQYMPAGSFRTEDETQAKEADAAGHSRSLLIEDLQPYTEYAFAVSVSNRRGRSPRALPPAICRTEPAPPEPPSTPRVLGANASRVVVSWRQTASPNGRLQAYQLSVQRLNGSRPASEAPRLLSNNLTDEPRRHYERLAVDGLDPGGSYEFKVRGVSVGGGVGRFSEPVRLTLTDRPPPHIVSFPHTFHVDRNASVMLDCEVVGVGTGQPKWKFPPVDPPPIESLSNGSLLIKRVLHDGEFSCRAGQHDDADSITYTVKAVNRDAKTTPPEPQLLAGLRTSTSLELLWRTSGSHQAGASVRAAVTHFDLRYSRGPGHEPEQRTLAGGNRSYLLDRVDCGASVDFSLRAVNGFDLKSNFVYPPLRLTAVGSPPVAASDADRWLVARQHRHGLELNFTALQPGDGCPPERYFVSLTPLRPAASSEPQPSSHQFQIMRTDLAGLDNCCHNLTEVLQTDVSYQLTVIASNAAGNSSQVISHFKARDLGVGGGGSGSGVGGGGGGRGIGGAGGGNEERPTVLGGPDLRHSVILPIVVVIVIAVAVFVVVIVAIAVIRGVLGLDCFSCFCSCCPGSSKDAAAEAPAALPASATGQPFLPEPPGLPETAVKGGRKVTLQVSGGKALPVLPPQEVLAGGLVEYIEEDRASIDTDGNLAWYASYNPGDSAAAAALAAGATLRSGSLSHLPAQMIRIQQQQQQQRQRLRRCDATEARRARDYQGVPTSAQLEQRRSHMSSSTTVSSARDELLDAYRVGKLRNVFQPGAAATVAEYDGSGSSGGSTDPGIRQFTCRPPGPNEMRKFTCEMPYPAADLPGPSSNLQRYRRQLSSGTDQTYERIDDGTNQSGRRATLQQQQRRQQQHPQHLQYQHQQRQRTSSDAGGSYGTGVYDSADGSVMDYYSYNYDPAQQQQLQYQQRRRLAQQVGGVGGRGGVYSTYQRSYQQPPPQPPMQHQMQFAVVATPQRRRQAGPHRERVAAVVHAVNNPEDDDEEDDEEEEERQQSRQLLEPAGTSSGRYYQPPPSLPPPAGAGAANEPEPESADPTYEDYFTEV